MFGMPSWILRPVTVLYCQIVWLVAHFQFLGNFLCYAKGILLLIYTNFDRYYKLTDLLIMSGVGYKS